MLCLLEMVLFNLHFVQASVVVPSGIHMDRLCWVQASSEPESSLQLDVVPRNSIRRRSFRELPRRPVYVEEDGEFSLAALLRDRFLSNVTSCSNMLLCLWCSRGIPQQVLTSTHACPILLS